jgi:hypothetical protein
MRYCFDFLSFGVSIRFMVEHEAPHFLCVSVQHAGAATTRGVLVSGGMRSQSIDWVRSLEYSIIYRKMGEIDQMRASDGE